MISEIIRIIKQNVQMEASIESSLPVLCVAKSEDFERRPNMLVPTETRCFHELKSINDIFRMQTGVSNSSFFDHTRFDEMSIREFLQHVLIECTDRLGYKERFFDLWEMNQEYVDLMIEHMEESGKISTELTTLHEENVQLMVLIMSQSLNAAYENPRSLLKKRLAPHIPIYQTIHENILCKVSVKENIISFELLYDLLDLLYEFMIQYILYYDVERRIVARPIRIFMKRDIGCCDYYFNMEKLNGMEMNKWLMRYHENTSIPNLLSMVQDLIILMNSLHEKYKFVHGDLKPDNLMIMSDGTIRILDFGLSYLEFKENRFMIDFSDAGLGPNLITGNSHHPFDHVKFLTSPYRFQSDMIYFFLMFEFYLPKDHLYWIWIKKTLFKQGDIEIIDIYQTIKHDYKAFILSKEYNLWNHFVPGLDIAKWMENFTCDSLLRNIDEFMIVYQSQLC